MIRTSPTGGGETPGRKEESVRGGTGSAPPPRNVEDDAFWDGLAMVKQPLEEEEEEEEKGAGWGKRKTKELNDRAASLIDNFDVETAKTILTVINEVGGELPIVGTVIGVMETIFDLVEAAQSNKDSCEKLACRVFEIGIVLREILAIAGAKTTFSFLLQLDRLKNKLGECRDFIKKFSERGWLGRLLKSGGDSGTFYELDEDLTKILRDAQYGVMGTILNVTVDTNNAVSDIQAMHRAERLRAMEEWNSSMSFDSAVRLREVTEFNSNSGSSGGVGGGGGSGRRRSGSSRRSSSGTPARIDENDDEQGVVRVSDSGLLILDPHRTYEDENIADVIADVTSDVSARVSEVTDAIVSKVSEAFEDEDEIVTEIGKDATKIQKLAESLHIDVRNIVCEIASINAHALASTKANARNKIKAASAFAAAPARSGTTDSGGRTPTKASSSVEGESHVLQEEEEVVVSSDNDGGIVPPKTSTAAPLAEPPLSTPSSSHAAAVKFEDEEEDEDEERALIPFEEAVPASIIKHEGIRQFWNTRLASLHIVKAPFFMSSLRDYMVQDLLFDTRLIDSVLTAEVQEKIKDVLDEDADGVIELYEVRFLFNLIYAKTKNHDIFSAVYYILDMWESNAYNYGYGEKHRHSHLPHIDAKKVLFARTTETAKLVEALLGTSFPAGEHGDDASAPARPLPSTPIFVHGFEGCGKTSFILRACGSLKVDRHFSGGSYYVNLETTGVGANTIAETAHELSIAVERAMNRSTISSNDNGTEFAMNSPRAPSSVVGGSSQAAAAANAANTNNEEIGELTTLQRSRSLTIEDEKHLLEASRLRLNLDDVNHEPTLIILDNFTQTATQEVISEVLYYASLPAVTIIVSACSPQFTSAVGEPVLTHHDYGFDTAHFAIYLPPLSLKETRELTRLINAFRADDLSYVEKVYRISKGQPSLIVELAILPTATLEYLLATTTSPFGFPQSKLRKSKTQESALALGAMATSSNNRLKSTESSHFNSESATPGAPTTMSPTKPSSSDLNKSSLERNYSSERRISNEITNPLSIRSLCRDSSGGSASTGQSGPETTDRRAFDISHRRYQMLTLEVTRMLSRLSLVASSFTEEYALACFDDIMSTWNGENNVNFSRDKNDVAAFHTMTPGTGKASLGSQDRRRKSMMPSLSKSTMIPSKSSLGRSVSGGNAPIYTHAAPTLSIAPTFVTFEDIFNCLRKRTCVKPSSVDTQRFIVKKSLKNVVFESFRVNRDEYEAALRW